jgi:hypothetical protein
VVNDIDRQVPSNTWLGVRTGLEKKENLNKCRGQHFLTGSKVPSILPPFIKGLSQGTEPVPLNLALIQSFPCRFKGEMGGGE